MKNHTEELSPHHRRLCQRLGATGLLRLLFTIGRIGTSSGKFLVKIYVDIDIEWIITFDQEATAKFEKNTPKCQKFGKMLPKIWFPQVKSKLCRLRGDLCSARPGQGSAEGATLKAEERRGKKVFSS